MERGARTGRTEGVFAWIGFQQRNQLWHISYRQIEIDAKQIGQLPNPGDEGEILLGIEVQIIVKRRRNSVGGDAAKPNRIAIRRRFRDRIHANIAARTTTIFDNETLPRQFRHARAIDARQHVRGTAGGKGIDVAHRPARPIARLRAANAWHCQKAGAGQHGSA